MELPVYKLVIDESDELGVSYIALVDKPAIEKNWFAFKENEFVLNPHAGESKDEYVSRCVSYEVKDGKSQEQAVAICIAKGEEHFAENACPLATQDIKTNLKDRQNAIDIAHYGPLNPNLPNDEYWAAKAKQFNTTPENAKQSICGNCSFFNVSQKVKDCIAQGIGNELDPYNVINAGELGYCEAFDFKCASQRTCDAWVVGGPVKFAKDKISFDFDETLNTARGKELAKRKIDEGFTVYIISARDNASNMFAVADELGIPHSRVYATGSNSAKIEKIKELQIVTHYDNNEDVVNALNGIGHKFKFFADKEKRMISGALMISDLPIYRRDEMGEYYVIFDKEQIEKIAQRFFKKGYTHNVNMMHDSERQVNGVYMVESFIIDKTRGIRTPEGYPTLTEGSWFGTFKVDNNEVWNDFIKTGVFKGFSVEGAFAHRKLQNIEQSDIEKIADRIQSLKQKIKNLK